MSYCQTCRGTREECAECEWQPPPVWPGNVDAWTLFEGMWTQWRGGGLGVIGLDYNVLPLVAEMVGATVTPEVFAKVTLLERKELTRMAARRTERG